MKNWVFDNRLYFLGAVAGAGGGFLYWKYVGCLTGTCAITSSPVNSTAYFALLGGVLFGFFKKEKKADLKE